MIVRKEWERYRRDVRVGDHRRLQYRDVYKGWFLFGVLPLYVIRERQRC